MPLHTRYDTRNDHGRSFPTGKKNCYELNANKSSKYLLRLRFLYGNFDLQNSGEGYSMKIIIDDTDVISDVSPTDNITNETISVCFGRIEDPPYINSIELRELDPHMYPTAEEDKILIVRHRYPSSNGSADIVRYPKNKYDRFWQPHHVRNVSEVHTNESISDGNSTEKVPLAVMQNAIQTINISTRLGLMFKGLERVEIEWAFYFAAFEKESKKRGINISGWGSNLHVSVGPFEVPYLKTTSILFKTIYIVSTDAQDYDIAFYKDGEPIMLNAWRYSYIHYRSKKKTDQSDFEIMRSIKKYFNIIKCTGDPCLPINYTWDKVGCVYDGSKAKVSSVDLSEMNLNMTLDSTVQGHFQNFTKLDRLRVLNLSNNNIQGELPDSLFKNHLLKIDYSNNPHLRRKVHGLTTIERNVVIITVVPISTIAMVIVFLIWRHVLGKMSEEDMEDKREELRTQPEEGEEQSKEKSAWEVPWLPPDSSKRE